MKPLSQTKGDSYMSEVLVVASKVKKYIKDKSQMSTSATTMAIQTVKDVSFLPGRTP